MALSGKDKRGMALVALSLSVIGAFIGVKVFVGKPLKAGPDGCVGAVTANTVIVVDHSEAFTTQTRHEIVARALAHVQEKVQDNERVSVFKVSDTSRKALEPVFTRCKPRQSGNRAMEDVRGLEKAYRTKFLEPLRAALDVPPPNGKESPIAQALIDVSLTQYLRGKDNTLLVFSDLLEHTDKFSLYTCRDPEKVVATFLESRKGAQGRPLFRNTTISLNVVPRTDVSKPALACRDRLWPWFLGDSEGSRAKAGLDYLPGT